METIICIRQQADTTQIDRCKDKVTTLNGAFTQVANGLEMAGNTVRLKILFLLFEESRLCVCDLSDILGITVSAVSQHLRKMKDRNLIYFVKEGQTIYYALMPDYATILKPFFKIIADTEILEVI